MLSDLRFPDAVLLETPAMSLTQDPMDPEPSISSTLRPRTIASWMHSVTTIPNASANLPTPAVARFLHISCRTHVWFSNHSLLLQSPNSQFTVTSVIDPEAVIERLLLEAERLKMLDAQRYDPRSRTCSPEPFVIESERVTPGPNPITIVNREDSDSGSSYGSASDSPSGYSFSPDPSELAESISDAASSIRFAEQRQPKEPEASRLASSWRTGHTVTTRTIIHPVARKTGSSKPTTPLFTPSTSRAISPKNSRAILRSLTCVSDEHIDRLSSRGKSSFQPPAGESLAIFVTQQVERPLSDEDREREQLWREAMCSLHFGGNWEQMNKRFPSGHPRW
ncbi:hypothetical protein C8R41DRAFT_259462 [Lentinula lateritia]|uniref:Uncharacterized protein n=1 Tax=Lentinula lateritia TaxID=40482 RepID=A0ABQ8VLI9_9AGAR|nr:hypothetical protein C8R41DRAFT_259462 [Lentinula lateritia]